MSAQTKLKPESPKPGRPQPVQLDEYGRDPKSPAEQFRRQSDYKADTGYAPFFAAWLADLPRLSSGHVCTIFLMAINVLSLGRPDNTKGKRNAWTRPVSVEDLAAICRCHVREIQRQIADCGERKIIAVKRNCRGMYSFSLLYRDWRALPDYQAGRPVPIDEPESDEGEPVEVAADAVRLCRRPLKVQAGRAGRALPVPCEVKTLRWQNAGPLPLVFDAVVQGGQLLVSTRFASDWRSAIGSEQEANESRRVQREKAQEVAAADPRARDVIEVFDPLLAATGERLLIGDAAALASAVKALGDMPKAYLEGWLKAGKNPRAERPISGPRVVASIIREAYSNWAASTSRPAVKAGPSKSIVSAKSSKNTFSEAVRQGLGRNLLKHGRPL